MTTRALAHQKQAGRLPATERKRLAERLLVEMQDEPRTSVDEAWVVEAEKRFAAWKQRGAKTVSAAKALQVKSKELGR